MKYRYSWSGPERAVSAEKVARHLSLLEEKIEHPTAQDFLESARPEDSEMHKLFEWDDSKAAEKYRLIEAQNIIRAVRVTLVERDEDPLVVRAFVKDEQTAGGYVHVVRALSDEEKKGQILAEARRDAEWFRKKYRDLEEAAGIISELDKFISEVA